MMISEEKYIAILTDKAWDKSLVSALIEMAGGYDALHEHKTAVCELLFTNSMTSRPDLKKDEPAALCSSVVLSDIEFLDQSNSESLSRLFIDHRSSIQSSLIGNWTGLGLDPVTELTHLTHGISDSEVLNFFNGSDINLEAMRYIVITTYYSLLVELANLQGELNGDRLARLDLTKLKQIHSIDAQLILDSGKQTKSVGFTDDGEMLDQIYRDYYIDFVFSQDAGEKKVSYMRLINKDKTAKLLPVRLACNELTQLMISGRSFVDAVMNNQTNEQVTLDCLDSSIVNIELNISYTLNFNISGTAKVVAAGDCQHIIMSADEQCTLFGTKLKSENFWSSCSDESRVFVNSINFTDDKEFREDASTTTVVNNAIFPEKGAHNE